jgi:hypothetical protein
VTQRRATPTQAPIAVTSRKNCSLRDSASSNRRRRRQGHQRVSGRWPLLGVPQEKALSDRFGVLRPVETRGRAM